MSKKIIAVFVAVLMMLSVIPVMAFAEETQEPETGFVQVTDEQEQTGEEISKIEELKVKLEYYFANLGDKALRLLFLPELLFGGSIFALVFPPLLVAIPLVPFLEFAEFVAALFGTSIYLS